MRRNRTSIHQRNLLIALHVGVVEQLYQRLPPRSYPRLFQLSEELVVFQVARAGIVAEGPVVVPGLDMLAEGGGQVLLRVDAGTASVHLQVGEEPAIRRFPVGRGIAAEKDAGIVVYHLGLDAYLTPPVKNERLRRLPYGIGGGLVSDSQRNAVVSTDAVAVGIFIHAVAPAKDDILGRYIAAIRPLEALFQLPRD